MKHLKLFEAYIDKDGELKDFNSKIEYPFDKIGKFVGWFIDEYGDYPEKQGWTIFHSDTLIPDEKYHSDRIWKDINVGGYWQVQRLDFPGEGEALIGRLDNDDSADDLAKKMGLMVDEYGVVYGWNGQSFLE